jgi:plastocyanin
VRRLLAGLLAGAALPGAAPAEAGAPRTKVVRLGDNYFLPTTLTVKRGTRIAWRWPAFGSAGQVHDVKLRSGPKGVRKFQSDPAASDYTYRRRLTVPGLYKLVCTYHDDMRMTIRVRR